MKSALGDKLRNMIFDQMCYTALSILRVFVLTVFKGKNGINMHRIKRILPFFELTQCVV